MTRCNDAPRHRFVETIQKGDMVATASRHAAQQVFGFRVAKTENRDLTTFLHDRVRDLRYDIQPLLVHQAGHHAEKRTIGLLQAKRGAYHVCDSLLARKVLRREVTRQVW